MWAELRRATYRSVKHLDLISLNTRNSCALVNQCLYTKLLLGWWMDYRCKLGLLGTSSTLRGVSTARDGRPELQVGSRDFFFFVPALLLSILTPLFLPDSSVCLSYIILAVSSASVWENTGHESILLITLLVGNCFFHVTRRSLLRPEIRMSKTNCNFRLKGPE